MKKSESSPKKNISFWREKSKTGTSYELLNFFTFNLIIYLEKSSKKFKSSKKVPVSLFPPQKKEELLVNFLDSNVAPLQKFSLLKQLTFCLRSPTSKCHMGLGKDQQQM